MRFLNLHDDGLSVKVNFFLMFSELYRIVTQAYISDIAYTGGGQAMPLTHRK